MTKKEGGKVGNEKLLKGGAAIVFGSIATFAKEYGLILGFVCIAIVLDVVTGLVCSYANGKKITKKKAYKGFWKKFAFICALAVGIFLDAFLPSLLSVVSIELSFNLPFGMIVGCYICLNEMISCCENIILTNSFALPKWLTKFLEGSRKKIDELADDSDEDEKEEQNDTSK